MRTLMHNGTVAVTNLFLFSTKYIDPETGILYYGFRYYSTSTGRWLSRDPIEEQNLLSSSEEDSIDENNGNLLGFVDNNAINGIDAFGLFLAAIDGTDSINWRKKDKITGRYNSHVRNFFKDYVGPGGKEYWDGPKLFGGGVASTVDDVYNKICNVLKIDAKEQINIVGHSRGGLIAILAAKKLKDKPCNCSSKINFMGLYDAVDRYIPANAASITDNVEWVVHARRNPLVRSRPLFGNCGTSGGQNHEEGVFWVTHSGAGGDPWGGDHPLVYEPSHGGKSGHVHRGKPTITKEQDEAGSRQVDAWVRSRFTGAI